MHNGFKTILVIRENFKVFVVLSISQFVLPSYRSTNKISYLCRNRLFVLTVLVGLIGNNNFVNIKPKLIIKMIIPPKNFSIDKIHTVVH